jgi:HAE1 family hydrophobic/amphiphilic exporter-1
LQDFRTTIVPSVTIPVSLIGTFAVMLVTGQSINNLTLFGLVLAIGIVVDDAIVVVENTMRLMDTEGLGPKEAVAKAMDEVGGAIVATTLVLLAVFAPTLVMPGLTGRMYRPFAITISVATIFSSINALTLSPALCGMLLRPSSQAKKKGWFFTQFDKYFDRMSASYGRAVSGLIRKAAIAMIAFAGLVAAMIYGFGAMPGGFVPSEDEGYFFVNTQLPNAASLQRTREVMDAAMVEVQKVPGVQNIITLGGYSLLDGRSELWCSHRLTGALERAGEYRLRAYSGRLRRAEQDSGGDRFRLWAATHSGSRVGEWIPDGVAGSRRCGTEAARDLCQRYGDRRLRERQDHPSEPELPVQCAPDLYRCGS